MNFFSLTFSRMRFLLCQPNDLNIWCVNLHSFFLNLFRVNLLQANAWRNDVRPSKSTYGVNIAERCKRTFAAYPVRRNVIKWKKGVGLSICLSMLIQPDCEMQTWMQIYFFFHSLISFIYEWPPQLQFFLNKKKLVSNHTVTGCYVSFFNV